jgi:hypothetical protein
MRRVSAYVSTLLILIATPADAARSTPIEITELLTKTYIASARCRFLPENDERELAGYFLHAKRALADIEATSRVEEALERGRAMGEAASCSSATRREIVSALDAARRAMTAAIGVGQNEQNH